MTHQDFLERPIRIGDYVAYPVRRGSELVMKKMRVTALTKDGIVGNTPGKRKVTIKRLDNVVILPGEE